MLSREQSGKEGVVVNIVRPRSEHSVTKLTVLIFRS